MWEFLQHLSFWDWLALGTLLLILEIFGPAVICCGWGLPPRPWAS